MDPGIEFLHLSGPDTVACGMAVFDVGWGWEVYHNALKAHIGQKLLLWDVPALG